MKQIKHIFVLLTIVTSFFAVHPAQFAYEQTISTEMLLERVMAEAQKTDHESDQLLSLALTLLRHGVNHHHQPLYAQAIFKLFSNIAKGVPYVNAYTLSDSLREIADCMPYYMDKGYKNALGVTHNVDEGHQYDQFKATVNTMLYCKFSTEYEAFKRDPDQFLQQISHEISVVNQHMMDLDKLRNTMVRFLELTLAKVIWSPEDQAYTWVCVKDIARGLSALFDAGVLEDINDLDDLFWSLVHRYVYFLDVVGSLMPSALFTQIQNDLAQSDLVLLTLPEQDTFMISKATILQRAIERAQMKARSFEAEGIL